MSSRSPTLTPVRSYPDLIERLMVLREKVRGLQPHLLGKVRAGKLIYPFWMLTTPEAPGQKKICLSGGIHGDEPAGAEAILGVVSMLHKNPDWMNDFHFTLFPCNNPFGYEHHTRENASKKDLNRQYCRRRPPAEVRFIKKGLSGKRFDLSIEFHEDIDTPGVYLYEISVDPSASVADRIIERVAQKYPINLAEEIEGAPSKGGIISPTVSSDFFKRRIERKREWAQAIYIFKEGTPHCITSETPIHLDMRERVEIHLTVLETALQRLRAGPK